MLGRYHRESDRIKVSKIDGYVGLPEERWQPVESFVFEEQAAVWQEITHRHYRGYR